MSYPEGWPRCVACDDYALDGHLTCGRAECNEAEARLARDNEWRYRNLLASINDRESSKEPQ